MEDLYTFLKKKLKEKKIKIGTFIELTNVSKSTVYRVMKGYQKPSYDLLESIYRILELDEDDKRKLNYYISTVDLDEGSIMASSNIQRLLFESRCHEAEDLDFVFYKDNEKYIKSLHEILNNFEKLINGKNADINMAIVHSAGIKLMNNINKYTARYSEKSRSMNIEHLISFSKYDATNSVDIVNSIIPMLKYPFYNLYYTENLFNPRKEIMGNYMMITASYTENNRDEFIYYVFSFMNDGIGTCYAGNEKDSIFDFFTRNYNYIKESYKHAIQSNADTKDFATLMSNIDSLDKDVANSEVYLFKKTPCYKRIPDTVFRNIVSRIVKSGNVVDFVKSLNDVEFVGEQEACMMLEGICDKMIDRYNAAKRVYSVDILSKKGLEDFVNTGLLSDHFKGMPAFSPEDRALILKDMKKRHMNPREKYNLYIIGDQAESAFILTIFKDKGFLIESTRENNINDDLYYCMIKNESMCNILYEFARDYVPSRLAMIDNEAMEYLDHLIKKAEDMC